MDDKEVNLLFKFSQLEWNLGSDNSSQGENESIVVRLARFIRCTKGVALMGILHVANIYTFC